MRVFPSLLTNSAWLNHRRLTFDETSARAIIEIVTYVVDEGYDGFEVEVETVLPGDRAAYTDFVKRLGAALRERDKTLDLDAAVDPEAATHQTDALAYFEKRRAQITDADFRQQGYPIGGGAVESANKLFVDGRPTPDHPWRKPLLRSRQRQPLPAIA
jgi:hypothetical protein